MTDPQVLYGELKGELETLANPLFEFAERHVRKRGLFFPFGASLSSAGKLALSAALPEQEGATGTDVLSLLHEGLRTTASDVSTVAVAVCEWVNVPLGDEWLKITFPYPDKLRTDAIKVLVEHARGLTVAFYRPCKRRLLRGWQFGEVFVVPAEPEIGAWSGGKAV